MPLTPGKYYVKRILPDYETGVAGGVEIPITVLSGPFDWLEDATDYIEEICAVDKGGSVPENTYEIINLI